MQSQRPLEDSLDINSKMTSEPPQTSTMNCQPYDKFPGLPSRITNVRHALEIGSQNGLSCLWLANQNPALRVSTTGYCPHHAKTVRRHIKKSGLSGRVTVHEGDSAVILRRRLSEIEQGRLERVGFTYIDASLTDALAHFDLAVRMSYPGACILVDNVISWDLEDQQHELKMSDGRDVVREIGLDPRVDGIVMQTIGSNGFEGYIMAIVQ